MGKYQLPLLVIYEWMFTEKAFRWWKTVFRSKNFTWNNWELSSSKCCLTSDSQIEVSEPTTFNFRQSHYIHFFNERHFSMFSKGTCDGLPQLESYDVMIEWNMNEVFFDQTEIKIEISMEWTGKDSPPRLIDPETINSFKKIYQNWLDEADFRIKLIAAGNFDDVVKNEERVLSPPGPSSNPLKPQEGSKKIDVSRCSKIRRNWSVTLLIILLAIIIPFMSVFFYRVNSVNSRIEELAQQIQELQMRIETSLPTK